MTLVSLTSGVSGRPFPVFLFTGESPPGGGGMGVFPEEAAGREPAARRGVEARALYFINDGCNLFSLVC